MRIHSIPFHLPDLLSVTIQRRERIITCFVGSCLVPAVFSPRTVCTERTGHKVVAERGLLRRKKVEDLVVHGVPLCLGFILDDCISDRPSLPFQPRRDHSLIELRQGLLDHPLIHGHLWRAHLRLVESRTDSLPVVRALFSSHGRWRRARSRVIESRSGFC